MFEFEKTIEKFNQLTEYRYASNLYAFKEFIMINNGIPSESIKMYFQGIETSVLISSLNYYIESRGITSYGASQKYVSAIKEYFRFLISNNYIQNDKLMNSFGHRSDENKSFRLQVNKYLSSNNQVKESQIKEICSDDEIRDFIECCNQIISENVISNQVDKISFHKIRSALISKLIILTGIVYRAVYEIKLSNLDLQHATITINGFTIKLPDDMIDQFKLYTEVRENLNPKEDYLFIEFNGHQLNSITQVLCGFLKQQLGRGDVNGLVKYAIINMIREGMNQNIIKQFTGVGRDIYLSCEEYVIQELNKSRYVDSKLRNIESWDWL